MRNVISGIGKLRRFAEAGCWLCTAVFAVMLAGCGTDSKSSAPTPPQSTLQTYFAPYVTGTTNGGNTNPLWGPNIYELDDSADTFSQSTFALQPPQQQGPQVINAGEMAVARRGLLALSIATNYVVNNTTLLYVPTNYNPAKTGSFAVELPGQAGGLVQVAGQPVAPMVAAVACPSLKTAQSYEFLSIPAALIDSASRGQQRAAWDPKSDTAFGSVDISSQGSTVTFSNIQQHTLPSVGGSGLSQQQPASSVTGACGETVFGNTITVGQLTVKTPGGAGGQSVPPQASVGIGPSGLLVEHNGSGDTSATFPGTSPAVYYDNTLGAGTGAVGLPKPTNPLDPSALAGGQYLGFVYGPGIYAGTSGTLNNNSSSHLVSFGFSAVPSTCASIAPSNGTLIYGGDYTNDDPSKSSDGFGNCDLAIDLGAQDSANNGLFPNATVWLGASYAANTTGKTYSFPAVAIAGQLNGKYAIFLLGVDSTQPWAVYLLQSN